MSPAGPERGGDAFVEGRPIPVEVGAIEKELAALWRAAARPVEGGEPPLMHACLQNLVVCCRGAGEAERAEAVVVEVTRARPSRILIAVLDPAAPGDDLRAAISARCIDTPGGGRQVCCEQVVLTGSAGAAARLHGALLPLLVPDLPLIVWWPGDADLTSPLTEKLVPVADLLVVDSRRLADPARGLRRLAAASCPVSDLAWMGLRSWREMTAGMFDGPAFASHPPRVERIVVEQAAGSAPGGAPAPDALLLGAWAASRLGWRPAPAAATPRRGPGIGFDLTRGDGRPGALDIVQAEGRAAGPGRGGLLALTLETPQARFSVRRSAARDALTASVTMGGACPVPRTARAVERDEATLICRSLEERGRDPAHQRALQLAAELIAGGKEGRR